MQKTVSNFYEKNNEQFQLMQKTNFMNAISRFEYTSKHDVQRANFINVETDFINAEKQIRLL